MNSRNLSQQTHSTPTKSLKNNNLLSNNASSAVIHTTPQVQGSEFLFYSPPEYQPITGTGRKHPRGEEVSTTEQENSTPTHYRKTSSRLRNGTVDIRSPYLVEKLEFSSPPPTQSCTYASTTINVADIAEICHTAVQLQSDAIEDIDDAVMETVTVRAEQKDSKVGLFCTWDEHWWVQRPLVEVNSFALRILEDGLYSIELDIGPTQISDNIDANKKMTESEEKGPQYTHLLVLSYGNISSKSKSGVDPPFTVHCTIPVAEFALGRIISLSLRARDKLLLLRRPNPHTHDSSPARSTDSSSEHRIRQLQLLDDDDVDAIFPVMRLRRLDT